MKALSDSQNSFNNAIENLFSKVVLAISNSCDTSKTVYIHFTGKPTGATRPRITKFGGRYYQKSYTKWRDVAVLDLSSLLANLSIETITDPVVVTVAVAWPAPKKTDRLYPAVDNDNVAKGPLDAVTNIEKDLPEFNKKIWEDDDQVVALWVTKRYESDKKSQGIFMSITPLNIN